MNTCPCMTSVFCIYIYIILYMIYVYAMCTCIYAHLCNMLHWYVSKRGTLCSPTMLDLSGRVFSDIRTSMFVLFHMTPKNSKVGVKFTPHFRATLLLDFPRSNAHHTSKQLCVISRHRPIQPGKPKNQGHQQGHNLSIYRML